MAKTQETYVREYQSLSAEERHLLQMFALNGFEISRAGIVRHSAAMNWTDAEGRKLTNARAVEPIEKLKKRGFLIPVNGKQNSRLLAHPLVEDFVVQQSVRDGQFDAIANYFLNSHASKREYGFAEPEVSRRDARIAFYSGDVDGFNKYVGELAKRSSRESVDPPELLTPFDAELFEQLHDTFKEQVLLTAGWKAMFSAEGSATVLEYVDVFAASRTKLSAALKDLWLSLAMARGDVKWLDDSYPTYEPSSLTGAGCASFLRGDVETARMCFPLTARGANKFRPRGLSGVACLLSLLKSEDPTHREQAEKLCGEFRKAGPGDLRMVATLIQSFIAHGSHPSDVFERALRTNIDTYSRASPLIRSLAAHVQEWSALTSPISFSQSVLAKAAESYERLGLYWLAALADDAARLAGTSASGTSPTPATSSNSQTPHQHHSLVEWLKATPAWEKKLTAVIAMAAGSRVDDVVVDDISSERMLWEIAYSKGGGSLRFSLRPFVQKRSESGKWSKGRPVALERIYEDRDRGKFDFATTADKKILHSVTEHEERNWRGYTETSYFIDDNVAILALVGHPNVYRKGNRETPIEIVERKPRLIIRRGDDGVELTVEPKPKINGDDVLVVADGPGRLAVVKFTDMHLNLAELLHGGLTVPERHAVQVIEAARVVSAVIETHSELVGDEAGNIVAAADEQAGNPRPHLHVMPYHAGLRAEFYVRPFGDVGPFFHPGEGGDVVFATVNGTSLSARRDFAAERQLAAEIVSACRTLETQVHDPDGGQQDEFLFGDPMHALEFLEQIQPLTDPDGLQIHWPKGKTLTLAGTSGLDNFQLRIRKDRDWFAASGTLTVNKDLTLDMMALIDLLDASPSRFVRMSDGRFLALTDQLRRRLEEVSAYGDRSKDKIRFPGVRAFAMQDFEESMSVKTDKHWRAHVGRIRQATEITPKVPSTFHAELRDYQLEGFHWLCRLAEWGVGACLADDMGLGKTIQALAVIVHRAAEGPTLVVAPTSVCFNWIHEAERFAPTLNVRQFGPGDRDAFFKDLGPRDLVVTSYGLLDRERKRLSGVHWQTVVLDEAQAIKNLNTNRSKAAMSLTADYRIALTGTPMENHLGELWNLYQFLNPGLLGSVEQFQQRYMLPIERDGESTAKQRLKRLIQPFILRRTKAQVLEELPPRTEVTLSVELSDEEAAFYEALRQSAIKKLASANDSQGRHVRILAEITRLRQACCHPDLITENSGISSSKLSLFGETIEELLDNGHQALVFSQFVGHLTILREELDRRGVTYLYLDGSTPAAERRRQVEAFQNGAGDVFLISLRAGGLGLNLTAADYVLHMDPWWNPAVEDQASDRAHRIGQHRPVTIYRFVTRGTIEERIVELHATKRDLADSLLEGSDISGKLTANELLDLMSERT
ncbi:MAG: DEAD/DEAH box helicase [Planctomycetota bacterium]|nr:DEAD/DEAH box helicase [Planctomycetota bacterium]